MGLVLLSEIVTAMEVLLLLREVLALSVQSLPKEPSNMLVLYAVEVTHTPHKVCTNDDAD